MSLAIIVAVAEGGAIGRGGDLAFHISADLRRFKALTMGHPVIMGRKTFESLPKGALPGRRNIVVSRREGWNAPGVETARSLTDAVELGGDGSFIIGGGQVYSQAMPLADTLHVTRIYAPAPDADTFFPEIDPAEWISVDTSPVEEDPRSGVKYRFETFKRKN